MNPKWKDTSSWYRGEDRAVPKQWTLDITGGRLVIHHIHGIDPRQWFASAVVGGGHILDNARLDSEDPVSAQREAAGLLRQRLRTVLADLEAWTDEHDAGGAS